MDLYLFTQYSEYIRELPKGQKMELKEQFIFGRKKKSLKSMLIKGFHTKFLDMLYFEKVCVHFKILLYQNKLHLFLPFSLTFWQFPGVHQLSGE